MVKRIKIILAPFPFIGRSQRQKGTISTISPSKKAAKKFVDIRTRINKAGGYAMGGQASESVARSKIIKDQRDRRRKEVDEMLDRVYGKPKGAGKSKIVPKKKPKRDK